MTKLPIYLLAICLLSACGQPPPPSPTGEQMVARACDDLARSLCGHLLEGVLVRGQPYHRCVVKEIRACLEEEVPG